MSPTRGGKGNLRPLVLRKRAGFGRDKRGREGILLLNNAFPPPKATSGAVLRLSVLRIDVGEGGTSEEGKAFPLYVNV